MNAVDLLFGCSLVGYFLGSVLFLADLFLKDDRIRQSALSIALLGVVFHTLNLVKRGISEGGVPFATTGEGWSFLSWAVMVVFLAVAFRPNLRPVGAVAVPAALLSALIAASVPSHGHPILESTGGWGLGLHVPASILSLAAFVVAFGCAVLYLVQDHLLRQKSFGGMFRSLPALDALDATSYWLAVFGFCLLTVGLITGGILAQAAWGSSWLSHPKSYSSILLWIVYAVYLYVRGVAHWRGRRTHTILVAAAVLLMLFYGGTSILTAPVHAGGAGQPRLSPP